METKDYSKKVSETVVSSKLTGVGLLPRKFRSEFSPNRYDSGCGVSNLSPPIMKWDPK